MTSLLRPTVGAIDVSDDTIRARLTKIKSEAPLSHLAASGDTAGMRSLLATCDFGDQDLRNTLIVACLVPSIEPLQVLIDHGIDVNARPLDGESALATAAFYRHLDKVHLLIDHGADPNVVISSGALLASLCHQADNYEVVDFLIQRGADVHAADSRGRPALHVAAGLRTRAMTEVLLRAGAHPNQIANERTPVDIAIEKVRPEILQLLLDAGGALPARAGSDKFWKEVRRQLTQQQASSDELAAVRRIVRSALLAKNLDAAMTEDDKPMQSQPAHGPSPL